jgi:hypothetical protein
MRVFGRITTSRFVAPDSQSNQNFNNPSGLTRLPCALRMLLVGLWMHQPPPLKVTFCSPCSDTKVDGRSSQTFKANVSSFGPTSVSLVDDGSSVKSTFTLRASRPPDSPQPGNRLGIQVPGSTPTLSRSCHWVLVSNDCCPDEADAGCPRGPVDRAVETAVEKNSHILIRTKIVL